MLTTALVTYGPLARVCPARVCPARGRILSFPESMIDTRRTRHDVSGTGFRRVGGRHDRDEADDRIQSGADGPGDRGSDAEQWHSAVPDPM